MPYNLVDITDVPEEHSVSVFFAEEPPTLNMKAIRSPETSIKMNETTFRRHSHGAGVERLGQGLQRCFAATGGNTVGGGHQELSGESDSVYTETYPRILRIAFF
jgi:hypothetical protein